MLRSGESFSMIQNSQSESTLTLITDDLNRFSLRKTNTSHVCPQTGMNHPPTDAVLEN